MRPYYEHSRGELYHGGALATLRELEAGSVHCCVTSPPYWGLRDYGVAGQLGLERTPEEFIARMVEVFHEVKRVLRDDGTLWLNIGDSYAGSWGAQGRQGETGMKGRTASYERMTAAAREHNTGSIPEASGLKPKDLIGIPWMLAFALRADGWYLRSEIIWHKPNPMPESVQDRPTKAHEQIFLLAKSERYYYDFAAIKEPATGNAHARGDGVNPKSMKWPNAWSAEPGRHDGVSDGRFRPKQNASFSEAVRETVENRNKRSVWTVPSKPFPEAHFATFPQALIYPCILAGCPLDGTVLDPFSGAGTTALVAKENGRRFVGIELSAEYCAMAKRRLGQEVLSFSAAGETQAG